MNALRALCPVLSALALTVAAVPAARAEFSSASLNGKFTSHFLIVNVLHPHHVTKLDQPATVVLEFDGAGNVTGSRSVTNWDIAHDAYGPLAPRLLRQALSGTYSIDADGTGIMSLASSPQWQQCWTLDAPTAESHCAVGSSETWHLALNRGGAGFSFGGSMPVVETTPAGMQHRRWVVSWAGDAVSQDSPCGGSPVEASSSVRTRRP